MLRRRLILSGTNFWNRIINLFRNRVIAENGTFEGDACLQRNLPIFAQNLYDKASLIITPNAYKAGKIYALKPTNGSGDLAFARASTRTRRNASGAIESLANNVPALNYPVSGCPTWLFEPQRTNLWISSNVLSPTYVQLYAGTIGASVIPSPLDGVNWLTYAENSGAGLNGFYQGLSVVSGSTYTLSAYVKQRSGNRFFRLSFGGNFPSSGGNTLDLSNGSASFSDGVTGKVIDLGGGIYRFEITQTANGTGNSNISVALSQTAGGSLSYTGDGVSGIYITGVQFELGAFASSLITTTTGAVTRVRDLFNLSNVYTNGLISAAGGTWFVSLKNNAAYTPDVSQAQQLSLGNNLVGPTSDNIFIGTSVLGRLRVWKNIAGSLSSVFETTADTCRLAMKWNGVGLDVFQNGVKVVTGSAFSPVSLETLSNAPGIFQPVYIDAMALYAAPLTDAECIALTT